LVEYRSFTNTDPPKLVKLWHSCQLGRGAAEGFTTDAMESTNFSQLFFDRDGLIVAELDDRLVGFIHAGFGPSDDFTCLDCAKGVICTLMVLPEFYHQGIASELLKRAEKYLIEWGARSITAGPPGRDAPFNFGLYGGSEPSGFHISDKNIISFFEKKGYQGIERFLIFDRHITETKDPVNFRLATARRKMKVVITHQPNGAKWWWFARLGRLDSVRFQLVPKDGGLPVAGVTATGLDYYLNKWHERSVGLIDLNVVESERRKGYGQLLIADVCKKLREELVTHVEAHASENDEAIIGLLQSTGFSQIDESIVF
jgi:GNAT superfamily N-acetyltransferase